MSDYHSPYGFGPAIDSMLDVLADRHDLTPAELSDLLHKNAPPTTTGPLSKVGIYDWIDLYWWEHHLGPALDALDDLLFPPKDSATAFREAGNR